MTRCTTCGGRLMAEPVEAFFQRGRSGDVELVCLWCGRGPEAGQELEARVTCSLPGCLKDRAPGSTLCASHRGVATRTGRAG